MASKRVARLNEQLKRELSELIRTQVRDRRVGVVTVTAVEMASDLGSARVFVRIIGDEAEFKETLAGLEAAAPFLRGLLGRILHIRRIPELRFREDRSMEHARRIEQLLSEVDVPEEETVEVDAETPPESSE
ncbi:MAG TPA: 30S ribosome-binding factor RbfA [Gemmatimonadetes bacterium]|jgi:ribosome-binding factor A|nr:30S ribosome-binding factor RbfA [Gemmatimonadota bacterium]